MPERVIHPKYGPGTVRATRYKGFELQVTFDDGLTRWVQMDELKEVGLESTAASVVPGPPILDEHFNSRRMIEAFRLGIVPHGCVDEFTFGRDEETQRIVKWLTSSNDDSMLVIGEYGTGKTHLLQYAMSRALQEGFAVAWVEMDPNECPFHKPKRVYSHLVRSFKYRSGHNGQLRGFRSFLREILAHGAFKDHYYLKHLIGRTSNEDLWDWIEAKESSIRPWSYDDWGYYSLPGLYDYSTAANIYCYLLSAFGWAAREILDLKGLLLVFDEAEIVEVNFYSYQAQRSRNFLRALIRTANGETRLLESPWKSGIDYCGVGIGPEVPFLYKRPSGLKLLLAFTSLAWNYKYWSPLIEELETLPQIDLEPLSDEGLRQIFEHVCLLYDSAYDFLEEDITIDAIFRKVNRQQARTRLFVKGTVESLDLVRFYPEGSIDEVLR